MTATTTERPPAAPPARTVSILPAAGVLLIAIVTLCTFAFLNVFDASTTTSTTLPIVLGGLPIDADTAVFSGFVQSGAPPDDIASSLIAPVGTLRAPHAGVTTGGGGVGSYDQAVRLVTAASRPNLLGFYRSNLQARGWKLYSVGTYHGGAELLFQKAGSDSWYWEVGVIAMPSARATTTYTFRLFQASDVI